MATVLPSLALLACPIGMGLMMWLMGRKSGDADRAGSASLEELRAEHSRLGIQLEEAERHSSSRS